MKSIRFLVPLLALGLAARISAQQMNYQGRLTDATGAPLPGPQASLNFSLWDAPTGGTEVWGDFPLATDLIDGRFSVKLGDPTGDDGNGRLLAEAFGGPRFLQIQIGADAPLPRQEVLPAPVALHAMNAEEVLADGRKLAVQTGPSLPGGPTNFQPDGGRAGWLMEFRDPVDGNHAGLFMNGNTAALYNSGTGGLLNLYDEDELSDPSPAGPKFTVDANGGVVSDGGASFVGSGVFGGDLGVTGEASFGGVVSNGPAELAGDTMVGGDLQVFAKDPEPIDSTIVRRPFQILGKKYPQRPGSTDELLLSYQMDNDDDASFSNANIAVGLVVHWGSGWQAGGGSWTSVSDARLKKDVRELEGSLERLGELRPVTYRYRNETRHGVQGTQIGFIAQEVEEIFPDWVHERANTEPLLPGEVAEPERIKGIGFTGFEALTVDAFRELRAEKDRQLKELEHSTNRRISELKTENGALRAKLSTLEARLDRLEGIFGEPGTDDTEGPHPLPVLEEEPAAMP